MIRTLRFAFSALALTTAGALPLFAQNMYPVKLGQSAAPDVSIRLVGSFAKLTVTGWDRDSISLTGSLPIGATLTGTVGNAPLRVTGAKMNLQAPEGMTVSAGTLELRVPVRARLQIRGGSADVSATGVVGELDINVIGGSVRVAGSPRLLTVDAMDASVTVDGSPEYVRLKSAAGDIVMTGGSPDAGFTSISGNIRVSAGTLERARFETVEGSITFSGDVARGASLTFDTHSGNIELSLGAKVSLAIDAASFTGTIENSVTRVLPAKGRDDRGQELVTEVGGGNARAVIRTFKGVVRLMRR